MKQYHLRVRALAHVWLLLTFCTVQAAGAPDPVNELQLVLLDSVNELPLAPVAAVVPAVVSYPEPADPWERFNRGMFGFNHGLYTYALIPAAKGYRKVVPQPVRTRVGMVFGNLQEPLNSVSHLFRGQVQAAGTSLLRFLANSTVGVLGVFDPATSWGLKSRPSRFDQALAQAGVGRGPYVVWPVLGPGDLRGGGASVGEALLHPLNFLLPSPDAAYAQGAGRFQAFAPGAETYETLYRESEDPYRYFRNQYLQGVQRDDDYERE